MNSPILRTQDKLFASTEITYPLRLWRAASQLLAICLSRRGIQPPDSVVIQQDARDPRILRLAISKDGYVCSVKVEDDTDTLNSPYFRSGCHALIDAYVSRAQGEPLTAGVHPKP